MTEHDVEEYKALRATVRQRGTVRPWACLAGLSAWAVVTALTVRTSVPLLSILPLLLLAAAFEVVFALHVGVERIGRYLQVFHDDRWEQTAMAFGAPLAGTGTDPLFIALFGLATVCNFAPAALGRPGRTTFAALAAVHALFLVRLGVARQAARKQRAADLARFLAIKGDDQRRTH